MTSDVKILTLLLLWVFSLQVGAVQISSGGIGQVLIYPYYTVNNNLNTLYSIVNTSAQPKALKVRFLEAQNSSDVLTFNVYLAPYDVWTGVLVPIESTVPGHLAEASVLHLTGDNSC